MGYDAAPGGGAAHPGRALLEALGPLDSGTAGLLSALSHELRTPLTSVLGYLELITDGSLGPMTADQQRVLLIVAEGVARLTSMIEDLEPYGRAARG
jgi:two-component system phosphate regulon sensor histidine kinase PhoR